MKITRKNIVSKVSEKQNGMYSLKELDSIISDCLESIGEYLEEGETFEITERSEHQGINPATKEKIMIPATKNVKFRPSKSLKERVKK